MQPESAAVPQPTTTTVTTGRMAAVELRNMETMTNPSELGEIPVTRVSFGTPLTSVPNAIQTQFIADRRPSELVRKIPLEQKRSNSVRFINISSNTPPFSPDTDGQRPLNTSDGVCDIAGEEVRVPSQHASRNASTASTPKSKARTPLNSNRSTKSGQSETVEEGLPIDKDDKGTGVEKEDASSDLKVVNVDRETTPGKGREFIEVVDTEVQTEISLYKSMATTPIPTRQPTAKVAKRTQHDGDEQIANEPQTPGKRSTREEDYCNKEEGRREWQHLRRRRRARVHL